MAKPAAVFRASRGAKVAVWDNGDKGFSISIQMPTYKDDSGVYRTSAGLWPVDVPSVMNALDRAMKWCEARETQKTEVNQEAE